MFVSLLSLSGLIMLPLMMFGQAWAEDTTVIR